MAGKESNPIQQRMDLLLERWGIAVAQPGVNIIRIHAEDNEKDMVDAFYTYLLGVDTNNHDIPVIFNSVYRNDEQYSKLLVQELEELIDLWNNSNKDRLTIEIEPIDWKPDYNLVKDNNPAYMFIENMNRLATYLNLKKGSYLVAALRASFLDAGSFSNWLRLAIEAGMVPKFKIVVDDHTSHPFYEKLAIKFPKQITTLKPKLDMDNAMQQVSAMGNPNDPAVQFRKAYVKLMQAIAKREEKEAEIHGAACIEIAIKNLPKNVYWIGQIIAVYAALANDQVGYKNYKKGIGYSSLGVQAAEKSQELIPDEYICRKFMAQALMLRAALYAVDKDWPQAIADFSVAAENYVSTKDIILAMEAYRMVGFSNKEYGNTDAAGKALARALQISKELPENMIRATTFPGVVELLFEVNNFKYISQEEVEAIARSVYGNDWLKEIMNWKNPHIEPVQDSAKVVMQL